MKYQIQTTYEEVHYPCAFYLHEALLRLLPIVKSSPLVLLASRISHNLVSVSVYMKYQINPYMKISQNTSISCQKLTYIA